MNMRFSFVRPVALGVLCLGAAAFAGCAQPTEPTRHMGGPGAQRVYPNNAEDPTRATDPLSAAVNPVTGSGGPASPGAVPPGSMPR